MIVVNNVLNQLLTSRSIETIRTIKVKVNATHNVPKPQDREKALGTRLPKPKKSIVLLLKVL